MLKQFRCFDFFLRWAATEGESDLWCTHLLKLFTVTPEYGRAGGQSVPGILELEFNDVYLFSIVRFYLDLVVGFAGYWSRSKCSALLLFACLLAPLLSKRKAAVIFVLKYVNLSSLTCILQWLCSCGQSVKCHWLWDLKGDTEDVYIMIINHVLFGKRQSQVETTRESLRGDGEFYIKHASAVHKIFSLHSSNFVNSDSLARVAGLASLIWSTFATQKRLAYFFRREDFHSCICLNEKTSYGNCDHSLFLSQIKFQDKNLYQFHHSKILNQLISPMMASNTIGLNVKCKSIRVFPAQNYQLRRDLSHTHQEGENENH